MISLPEHIEIILEKHLKGPLNSADTKVLEQWRAEKQEHELLYKQLLKVWQESGTILEEPVYNANRAWNKVDLALKRGKSTRNYRLLLAASLIGVLFIAGWMFFGKRDITTFAASSNRSLVLPDGSTVILRKGASLSFEKAFKNREVSLTGEAYFDVRQDKAHPFRIQTTRSTLEVLGTSFTMTTNHQYDRLVVTIGSVAFINKKATTQRQVISASQAAVLNDTGFNVTLVKDLNYYSWVTGVLAFENTPIQQVAAELSDYYHLVIIPDSGLSNTITAKFVKQPVEEVLEEIKLLSDLDYRKQHDTILLFKP